MTAASARADPQDDAGAAFLAQIADPRRPRLSFRAAVVVAHPDDETIGCGAQLPRFDDVLLIHTTDGAPRRGSQPEFSSWRDYAETRHRELAAATALAGVPAERLKNLGWPDQEAAFHLAEIAESLTEFLGQAEAVLTHAYEGGHPDHDASAFAVHAAVRRLKRDRGAGPEIVEMPLYHAGPSGRTVQIFSAAPGCREVEVNLSETERALKERMLAAHHSQREVTCWFQCEVERFRAAPRYDFARLPNGGRLYYEEHDWGLAGRQWLELAAMAQRELGLQAVR